MTQKTVSESLFEGLCTAKCVPWSRIPTAEYATPDYDIVLGVQHVLVEIKQLDANKSDERINKALDAGEEIAGVASPAPRLRLQIAAAYRQLKRAARQGQACLLIVYNNSSILNFLDSFTVTTAMFGRYGVRLGIDKAGVIRETGRGFMGNAKVTRNDCKSLSAIGVLKAARSEALRLDVYHNPFALVSIDPNAMRLLADGQFRHSAPHDGVTVDWEPAVIDA